MNIQDLEQYRNEEGRLILADVDLQGSDLRGADLRNTDLHGADLRGADLRGADLRAAVLRGADSREADLRGVDLRNTDLRGANLRGADLRGADLRLADLRGANLYDVKGKGILTFQYKKHFAYCYDGHIQIGCKVLSIGDWKEQYKQIGEQQGYTEQEIEQYGKFIKQCSEL